MMKEKRWTGTKRPVMDKRIWPSYVTFVLSQVLPTQAVVKNYDPACYLTPSAPAVIVGNARREISRGATEAN